MMSIRPLNLAKINGGVQYTFDALLNETHKRVDVATAETRTRPVYRSQRWEPAR